MNPQGLPSPTAEEAQSQAGTTKVSWIGPDIAYNETYENDLMEAILSPPEPAAEDEDMMDIDLPITQEDLPLPLHDFRRKRSSKVPGISVPTPTSDLHGGPPPPDEYLDDQMRKLLKEQGCKTNEDLSKYLDTEITSLLAELSETMRKREEAVKTNEGIEKELKQLEMEREMQKRVEEKWRQGRRASKASND